MPPTRRCAVQTPLHLNHDGQEVLGEMRLKAHTAQSYDVHVRLKTEAMPDTGEQPQVVEAVFDLKDPYYRQLKPVW